MIVRTDIATLLLGVLTGAPFSLEFSLREIERTLETPREDGHGDLAFPCFPLAKKLKRAPQQLAAEIGATLNSSLEGTLVVRVEVVGAFLNFFVQPGLLADALLPSIISGVAVAPRPATGKRMMIEYSQPNTHKAFHVGHTRCASLGDSLIRIFEWSGLHLDAVNYLGDEGTHVAKCLWYLLTHYEGRVPEGNRGEFLGTLYVKATELLSLDTLTAVALPKVTIGEIVEVFEHPVEKTWSVLKLETANGVKSVVCGTRELSAGEKVLWLAPGNRLGNREIGVVDKKGALSEGMILSEAEAGLSENKKRIARAPTTATVGEKAAEVFRYPGQDLAGKGVLETIALREAKVSEVLRKLEASDPEVREVWERTKQWSLDEFYEVYSWLDCRFDRYFFESEFGEASKQIVKKYQEKGVFVPSEGAIGADLSQYGLGFCIMIKSDGTSTYAARDLVLAERKFGEFAIDRSLYVVDSAQTLHFQQVFKCLELMGYPQAADCHHLAYAQVVVPDGKMSSRKGNVILFSALRERLDTKITFEFLEKYRGEWPDEEIDAAVHAIALGTIRYGMLSQDNNTLIVFDLDAWTSKSGNTGPYMMYAYARTRSIVREVGDVAESPGAFLTLTEETERELLVFLDSYSEFIDRAAEQYAPSVLCAYVFELARRFNRWYAVCSVRHAETDALRYARLKLVESVGLVLRHGLGLLGIKTIERM